MKLVGFPEKKNQLIKRLTALTHKLPSYNGAPEFSYDIGPYRVLRDGSLAVFEDDADPVVIDGLIQEGLLAGTTEDIHGSGVIEIHTEESAATAAAEEGDAINTSNTSPTPPNVATAPEGTGGSGRAESSESSLDTASPGEEGQRRSEENEPQQQEVQAQTQAQVQASTSNVRTAAEPVKAPSFSIVHEVRKMIYDQPVVIRDRVVTVQTMVNLINMIYSKGDVINHALLSRRGFWVDEKVIAQLPYERPQSFQALMHLLKTKDRAGLVRGIEFTPNTVSFTAFPSTQDYTTRKSYEMLAEAMYRHATQTQWVCSKKQEPDNEKYYFRNWLNHIGMGGQENRTYREILLKNLEGNGSFRTKAQLAAYRTRREEEKIERRKAAIEHEELALAGAAN